MAKCDRCGRDENQPTLTGHTGLMPYMDENLCWYCWKKQDLHDQRDWEDDPECESEE